jgi:hypothetical protein
MAVEKRQRINGSLARAEEMAVFQKLNYGY